MMSALKMTNAVRIAQSVHQVFIPRQIPNVRSKSTSYRRCVRMLSTAKFFVGGNWKCNGTLDSVKKLVGELNSGSIPTNVEVVCAPPFIYLPFVSENLNNSTFKVAAQNCWVKSSGAFTGEISAEMLVDGGIPWVILGHSERRALCNESNEFIGEKVAYAQSKNLSVIACIGETLKQREDGEMFKILDGQMQAIIDRVSDWSKLVIAYEPVWAIGTGVVATPDQAQEVHAYLRKWLSEKVSPEIASSLRIIYGGSVNDANCGELASREDIDGFLVGGASLKGPAFINICNSQTASVKA
eukprot:g7368.t1